MFANSLFGKLIETNFDKKILVDRNKPGYYIE